MKPHERERDNTVAELHALATRLTAMLQEAEALRARVLKAGAANVWPSVPPAVWLAALHAPHDHARAAP
jgi:hypothetical protein